MLETLFFFHNPKPTERIYFQQLRIPARLAADSVLPCIHSFLVRPGTEYAAPRQESESLFNLHVHIASVLVVVQLICSWCFCTCRSLMSARVGFEQILRRSGQAGEIRQGESPLYPGGHDRLRIFCSTLATNRKRTPDHNEDPPSH